MWKLYEKLLPESIDKEKRKNFVKKIERILNHEWPNFEIKVSTNVNRQQKIDKLLETVIDLPDSILITFIEVIEKVTNEQLKYLKTWNTFLKYG
ncbi:45565_t:CDS:2 [Gigaspora margarita]|uniref:45565_t:CDS:1 n=1 Tax=Gigaspora margarita TaxID=4874 RepID=A0ABM8VZ71_GIGMA|nr:45565_t:CDS:2 [Gigaspora margarita]